MRLTPITKTYEITIGDTIPIGTPSGRLYMSYQNEKFEIIQRRLIWPMIKRMRGPPQYITWRIILSIGIVFIFIYTICINHYVCISQPGEHLILLGQFVLNIPKRVIVGKNIGK